MNKMLAGVYSVMLKGGREKPILLWSMLARICLALPFAMLLLIVVQAASALFSVDGQQFIWNGRLAAFLQLCVIAIIMYPLTGGDENFSEIIEESTDEQLKRYRRNWEISVFLSIVLVVLTAI